jgi:hypothetical protein
VCPPSTGCRRLSMLPVTTVSGCAEQAVEVSRSFHGVVVVRGHCQIFTCQVHRRLLAYPMFAHSPDAVKG